jgi:nicotinate-nucleotide adenylyltransferase
MNKLTQTRIGILGGTFNPVHLGHLIIAQNALEKYELSKVLFVPSATPPHKKASALASATHRVAMLNSVIESDPRFEVSDIEVVRKGPSYSVDTVAQLREMHPGAELYFIIGSDSLTELHMWKEIRKLLTMCTFVTFARPGSSISAITPERLKLEAPWPERLLAKVSSLHMVDISSSEIRYRVAEGMSIRYLVPQAVEIHIAENHLYGR